MVTRSRSPPVNSGMYLLTGSEIDNCLRLRQKPHRCRCHRFRDGCHQEYRVGRASLAEASLQLVSAVLDVQGGSGEISLSVRVKSTALVQSSLLAAFINAGIRLESRMARRATRSSMIS